MTEGQIPGNEGVWITPKPTKGSWAWEEGDPNNWVV
jgi:hypothetical protein